MALDRPTPWSVADIEHDYDIIDADGKVAARAAHGDRALAGYIADAVNLYSQIEAARTDSDGNRHLLQMEGKPVVIITPPPSEAEVVRTFRDLYNNVNQDRMMLMRGRMDALNECDRLSDELDKVRAALERANRYGMQADEENAKLRDLVRRLIPAVKTAYIYEKKIGAEAIAACLEQGVPTGGIVEVVDEWRDLLREAQEGAAKEDDKE